MIINKLTCLRDHNIVVVPVAYSKNKGSHTVASAGINKSLHGCLKLMQRHPGISCVLTTKNSAPQRQVTSEKDSSGNCFQRANGLPLISLTFYELPTWSLLSLQFRWRFGDSRERGEERRVREQQLIEGFISAPLASNSTEPIMVPPSSVNICFACDHSQ